MVILLTSEEEEDLVSFIIECAEIGYPKSLLEVITMAEMIASKKDCFKDRKLHQWLMAELHETSFNSDPENGNHTFNCTS